MKNKKIKFIILLCIILIVIFIPKVNQAADETANVTSNFDAEYYRPGDLKGVDYIKPIKFAGVILNAITIVGTVISVLMVMILGIKYMLGSVEEKAEYKKTMIPMLVGAILLFCTPRLVSIIYGLVTQMQV